MKVVQRITVKLEIDPATTPASLRAGMSAVVKVDTGHVRQLSSLL